MLNIFKHINTQLKVISLLTFICVPTMAHAGFITIDQVGLNNIFSQSSFSGRNIDVRINAFQSILNDDFLNIDSPFESTTGLLNLSETSLSSDLSSSKSIAMFFVDTVSECGGATNNAVGCAARYVETVNSNFDNNNASFTFFDSNFVSGNLGSHVIAHELAHVLGLSAHEGDNNARDNLMNPVVDINSVTTLTLGQVDTIFNPLINSLIQGTGTQNDPFFISLSPIAILSSVSLVPEPSTYAMLGLGLLLIGFQIQRRKP